MKEIDFWPKCVLIPQTKRLLMCIEKYETYLDLTMEMLGPLGLKAFFCGVGRKTGVNKSF